LEIIELSGSLPDFPPNIQEMNLRGNNITGGIPSFFGRSTIISLDLSQNWLSGTIPSSLFESPVLSTLRLEDNNLQCPDAVSYSPSLSIW